MFLLEGEGGVMEDYYKEYPLDIKYRTIGNDFYSKKNYRLYKCWLKLAREGGNLGIFLRRGEGVIFYTVKMFRTRPSV